MRSAERPTGPIVTCSWERLSPWVTGVLCQFDHSDGLAVYQSSARGMHLLKLKVGSDLLRRQRHRRPRRT